MSVSAAHTVVARTERDASQAYDQNLLPHRPWRHFDQSEVSGWGPNVQRQLLATAASLELEVESITVRGHERRQKSRLYKCRNR